MNKISPDQSGSSRRLFKYRTTAIIAAALVTAGIAAMRSTEAQSGLYLSTLAGISTPGINDGTGVTARFNGPLGITIDKDDNIIVADFRNARIRKVGQDGTVTTIAGTAQGFQEGPLTVARFYGPAGVAYDNDGNLLVADYANHRVRMLTQNGLVATIAGSGKYGTMNGSGPSARFAYPTCVLPDNEGNIYVIDSGTSLIRKIDKNRYVSTIAGTSAGLADGPALEAAFNFANGTAQMTFDREGNLIIADFNNSLIRKLTKDGMVTTIAGGGTKLDGPAREASFFFPTGIARDAKGNFIIADWYNSRIRKLDMSTMQVTTIAGNGQQGHIDGPALSAGLFRPSSIAIDSAGNIFFSDYFDNCIRKISGTVVRPPASPSPTGTPRVVPTATPTPSPTPTPTPTPTPGGGGSGGEGTLMPDAIVNPSFEMGSYYGWRVFTFWVTGGGALMVQDPDVVTDGVYALKFQANGRRLVDNCMQDLVLPPGTYTLKCDVTPSIGTVAMLGVNFNDNATSITSSTEKGEKGTLSVTFTVVDGTRPLTIFAAGNQNRYIRSNFVVDNFRLYRK